jgi:hypothetical protein
MTLASMASPETMKPSRSLALLPFTSTKDLIFHLPVLFCRVDFPLGVDRKSARRVFDK